MELPTYYMVSVDGRGAPRYRHNTFEDAFREALRIRQYNCNQSRGIRILQELAFIPPTWANADRLDFSNILFYRDVKVTVGFVMDILRLK
jgi:sporulation-control protein spo0M